MVMQLKRKAPPYSLDPQDIAHVALIVAAEGGVDWAAYCLVNCDRDHMWKSDHELDEFVEYVAEFGTKLGEETARKFFPDMKDKEYRT